MIRNDQEGYQIKQTSLHWAITGRQVFRLFEGLTKTCSASRGYKLNLTIVNDALKILCQCGILLCKKLRISVPKWNFSVIYDFLRDWSRPGLPCGLFKLAILTSQGYISEVFTVSKQPQRNIWWIHGCLRDQSEIFPSYLHRTRSHQYSHSYFRVFARNGWDQPLDDIDNISIKMFNKYFRNFFRCDSISL